MLIITGISPFALTDHKVSARLIFFSACSRHNVGCSYISEFVINHTSNSACLSRYRGINCTQNPHSWICPIMLKLALSIGTFCPIFARLVDIDKLFVHFPLIYYFNILYMCHS
jgi:hypothetical protein